MILVDILKLGCLKLGGGSIFRPLNKSSLVSKDSKIPAASIFMNKNHGVSAQCKGALKMPLIGSWGCPWHGRILRWHRTSCHSIVPPPHCYMWCPGSVMGFRQNPWGLDKLLFWVMLGAKLTSAGLGIRGLQGCLKATSSAVLNELWCRWGWGPSATKCSHSGWDTLPNSGLAHKFYFGLTLWFYRSYSWFILV